MTGLIGSISLYCCLALVCPVLAAGPFLPSEVPPIPQVQQEDSIAVKGENTRLVASGLTVFLGAFGAHRLYMGTTPKVAVVYGVTFGGFGALVLMDLGHLLFTKDMERFRNNDSVFMWNKRTADVTPP